MKNSHYDRISSFLCFGILLSAQLMFSVPASAGTVALATAPLANATTTTVLPNLLFLMDNSGSMGQDYTPDYMMEYDMRNSPWTYNSNDWYSPDSTLQRNCRDSADDDGSINTALASMDLCVVGDVPYMTSAINIQYYSPNIRYYPGVNADGSSYPSQTDPTNVLTDGYGYHNKTQVGANVNSINLTTNYPDRVWCTKNNPSAAELINTAVCRKNSNYLYPDATYKYGRDNDSTTNDKDVLGVYGAPYYYKVVVTEYCSEAELRNCVTSAAPTGAYTFPAESRWCSDIALSVCQSTKTSTYKYPRYPGASFAAVAASGSVTLANRNAGQGTNGRNVSSIVVGSVEILGATVSGATGMSSSTLASNIAAQINAYASAPEYTANAAGNVITITSTVAAGATANGTLGYTHNNAVNSKVNVTGGVTGTDAPAYTFTRVDIVPATPSYPKAVARTDCAGAVCTYDEEITNFANWYAYYRTRMQAMKSAASRAFQPIGNNYRVGFVNICKGDYLPIAPFDNSTGLIGADEATGTFRVGNSVPRTIDSILVGGVDVLGMVVSGTSRTNLAANIVDQINSFVSVPDYTAQLFNVSGSPYGVRIIASLEAGATANGKALSISGTAGYSNVNNMSGGVTGIGQKTAWFEKLFGSTASGCGTPLRSALATAGRIFAGKELSTAGSSSGTSIDPVQYSCQQNFALLTTDGYWNGAGGIDLGGAAMGNMDSDALNTLRPMLEGPSTSLGSLADVAKYYYDTDLRTSALNNCWGSLGLDVCENNVFVSSTDTNTKQHMTTFTLGLGVDGELSYTDDYNTATSGDFYNLKNGLGNPTVNWPVPQSDSASAIDDLWHAAVNGNGTYFSAKDPAQLSSGLNKALAAIGSKIGAASAAATSTMNPVAGNNFAFVASFSTVKWHGNLEARPINVDTGVVSETAEWCVETVTQSSCAPPSTIVADSSGSSVVYQCVTPGATLASCPAPGVLDGTDCKVEIAAACTGSLPGRVAAASDTRTIYKADGSGGLQPFVYANVNPSYFLADGLSQWSVLTASQKTAASGENLVNYLRGQTGFEDRTSNPADNRLYRFREAVMGDALESQPAFISKPVFSYTDPGYAEYKVAQAARAGTVFIGANDGMLHAFAADTGTERWTFVPSVVIPDLWRLADFNYSSSHRNYFNGSPIVTDVCTANCACDQVCVDGGGDAPVWKTILVSGLNAGGRSFFALDVTDPATPSLLWEISSSSVGFANLGYSFGRPIVTKKEDGTWVVLLTSGYNNVSPGDGEGYLYVVNAATGALISAIGTGAGDTTTPSGLAKIAAWNEFGGVDNTAGYVYGGDLLGNLWRFDINTAAAPLLFATLKDADGDAQPIASVPVLGKVNNQRMIFVGTGKYLELSDLTDESGQSIYAIMDADESTTLVNARTALQVQTLTTDGAFRTVSTNTVNYSSVRGWYIDLPDTGERVAIDMQLIAGALIAPTVVPSNTVCSPGGYGWQNVLNYETGSETAPGVPVSSLYSDQIVGVSTIYVGGELKLIVRTRTGQSRTEDGPPGSDAGSFTGTRVMWRELIQ